MDKAYKDAKAEVKTRGLEEQYRHFAITRSLRMVFEKQEVHLGRPAGRGSAEEEELRRGLAEDEEELRLCLEYSYRTSGDSRGEENLNNVLERHGDSRWEEELNGVLERHGYLVKSEKKDRHLGA